VARSSKRLGLEGRHGGPRLGADTREHQPDRRRKRGPKRGPNPWSKTIPTGHNPSQSSRGTRGDETPGPARDFGVWGAKEMVDRGRIELPTPGFSVPSFRLSWRVVQDSGPQTGTQRLLLSEPASHSRPVPKIGGHGRRSRRRAHTESLREIAGRSRPSQGQDVGSNPLFAGLFLAMSRVDPTTRRRIVRISPRRFLTGAPAGAR
jgi:hypothetical protein